MAIWLVTLYLSCISSQAKSSATAAMQGVSGGPCRAMLLSFATIENSSVMLCVFLIFTLTQFKSM